MSAPHPCKLQWQPIARSNGWVHRWPEQGLHACYNRSIPSGLGAAGVGQSGWTRDSEICVYSNSTINVNKVMEEERWGEYGSYGCGLWNLSYLNVSCCNENDGVSVVFPCHYPTWFISSKVDVPNWVIHLIQTPSNVYSRGRCGSKNGC